eukprot:1185573-Rhodomonas_salina.1
MLAPAQNFWNASFSASAVASGAHTCTMMRASPCSGFAHAAGSTTTVSGSGGTRAGSSAWAGPAASSARPGARSRTGATSPRRSSTPRAR